MKIIDGGYTRNAIDGGYTRNAIDGGYTRNAIDGGYTRNAIAAFTSEKCSDDCDDVNDTDSRVEDAIWESTSSGKGSNKTNEKGGRGWVRGGGGEKEKVINTTTTKKNNNPKQTNPQRGSVQIH